MLRFFKGISASDGSTGSRSAGSKGAPQTPVPIGDGSEMVRRNFLGSLGAASSKDRDPPYVDFSLHSILTFKDDRTLHTALEEKKETKRKRPNYDGRRRRLWAMQPPERRE